jgi:7-cyano-7-deazaguanine reductase
LALLLQQATVAEKVALTVTSAGELSNNAAREKKGMSRKPRKSSRSASVSSDLQLGRAVEWPTTPDAAKLDRVPNPQRGTNYLVRFTAPEFTSLCPVTGQPDFAHLVIDYVPGQWLLESKSLKLFIASFRNHGAFHEDCTVMIGKRIDATIKPKWLRIGGYWYPRGGIPIDVFWQTGKLPKDMWIPDQGVAPYRGRG